MSRSLRKRASWWLVRLQADDVTEADRAEFKAWLAADPRHVEAFEEVANAVDQVRGFKGELRSAPYSDGAARRVSRAALAGAGLALAAAAVLGVLWLGDAWPRRFSTEIGEQRKIALEDGSVVELNTDTAISVQFSSESRHVRLHRGEALFRVRRDPDRLFEVEAGGRSVRAIGTAFIVRLEADALRVTVTEGLVDVGSVRSLTRSSPLDGGEGGRVRVAARQRLNISDRSRVVTDLSEEAIARSLAWRDGMLWFNGEPLREVVREVERHTGATFTIADPALEELHVVAYLRANNLDGFIARLEDAFPDLVVRRSGDRVRINRRAERGG
jgi:transmembrane sensor